MVTGSKLKIALIKGTMSMRHKSFLLCIVTFTLLSGATSTAPKNPYASALEQASIQALSPMPLAVDFTLPTLQGTELSLSKSHGRWLLLTFFATWHAGDDAACRIN